MNGTGERGYMDTDRADLTTAQRDRATGAVVGMAVGNALGSGYAFAPVPDPTQIQMRAGGLGPYAAGEWADDTAMAMPILEALAAGADLLDPATQDHVAARWAEWFGTAKDVAPNIDRVLSAYDPAAGAESLRRAASLIHATGTPSAGNASMMRTTPVVLGFLHDPAALARAAHEYSDLTHASDEAGDTCALLNLAQRHAILHGGFDLAAGLEWIRPERQDLWERLITRAEVGLPQDFAIRNGRSGQMLQTIWSAISHSDLTDPEHFEKTLRAVIGAGGDTPTAAAVAGGLLGARWGVSAIPLEWRRHIHGWPGLRDADLLRLSWEALSGKPWPDSFTTDQGISVPTAHPRDVGLWLGGTAGLRPLPPGVDAVMSLCALGNSQTPHPSIAPENHVCVWLVDSDDPADNPNLDLVVDQAVQTLRRLRAEGRTVYLHGTDGGSRTALIAAVYGMRATRIPAAEAFAEIQRVLPAARLNPVFEQVLVRYDA